MKNLDTKIKEAMKEKNTAALNALRGLKSALANAVIEKREELTEQEEIGVVRRELKKVKETLASLEGAQRPDLALKAIDEAQTLEQFLPQQLTPDELETIVKAAIAESGAVVKKDMGKAMKIATTNIAGRADGKTVSALIQSLLQ